MKTNDSSAFPVHGGYPNDDPRNQIIGGGLTKREYFAAMAMQGLLSNPQYLLELRENYNKKVITDLNLMCVLEAIDMADELLKQLEK